MASQRGSALVLVLMTVAALLIVGVSLVSASTVEFRSAINQSHSTQAFYVAEAGLNWARREISTNRSLLSTPVLYRSPAFGGNHNILSSLGELEVRVTPTSTGWEVLSTGLTHLARRTVSLQITQTVSGGTDPMLTQHHSFSEPQRGNNTTVTGNIQTGTNFPDVVMPIPFANLQGRLAFSTTATNTPSLVAGQYPSIEVNHALNIHIPDSVSVLQIRTGSLTIGTNGSITVSGNPQGRVIFHIDRLISMSGQASINQPVPASANPNPARVLLVQFGSEVVKLTGQTLLVGALVTNTAPITIGGNGNIIGPILTNASSVHLGKDENQGALGGTLVYAPNARLTMVGNDTWTGVVVVNELDMGGKSSLRFSSVSTAGADGLLPFAGQLHFGPWNQRP